jgi:hypothetical protein
LRQAISSANTTNGVDAILFNMPGSGVLLRLSQRCPRSPMR